MQEITLRELCEKYNVSRRAIQGYEKAGLVAPSGKNKMGYLLYDAEAQKRIERIHLYQNIGFSIKEIKEIIDLPTEQVIPILEQQVIKLREENERIVEQLRIVYEMMKKD